MGSDFSAVRGEIRVVGHFTEGASYALNEFDAKVRFLPLADGSHRNAVRWPAGENFTPALLIPGLDLSLAYQQFVGIV